ncbi:MAG: ATP-binding cassette domain-containing protein [Saprospiraceae bacterium]|jgi:phospholipid/cholesterol/gamma-HCH transport system ATP-binding protein|uniref:ABC transporter ATP-binding protein n=1 Tax=Candidatus Brachybacter algidus TaxID=2982024 RepID=UPI001B6C3094|nr:ATP-binding cassette domain-containing protein [Candidatus Brachybacter algidus]MBP7304736.1 ATP-binding cassette domain-containing protein [Saprospiraceae bacterium]MBK6374272.1 ATP-binding cassette domain-containing protein [Candidatus Brachybacter algidus]MBK6449922.1 ATP-binding cassette domain-containing protein [Candidatus Brachybacter algidus]MBK7604199.1 ATP-binding cassette domain-containing protein [Candidatus Brachybacter algidus]MBK8353796.1 ATP-binding cassette domain-containin
MIKIVDIKKAFGENEVIKGITTTFETGKCNLIIGRSGAGKTVLLKILVGLIQPDQGEIWFDDINVLKLNKKENRKLRNSMGMLFQGSALFDSMRVEENIRFPLDMFSNMTKKEKDARVDYCLARVDLTGTNKLYPSELSGGMQKRVGIARAIVLSPSYLFCDEPNSGLDPKTSIVIDKLIKSITEELNITTVINTHDMNSVMEIGEEINFLADGKLVWQGSKEDVLDTDNEQLQNFIFASPFLQRLREKAFR